MTRQRSPPVPGFETSLRTTVTAIPPISRSSGGLNGHSRRLAQEKPEEAPDE
jgi:hypothetical protein